MVLQRLPRTYVRTVLTATRLPLEAAELVLGRRPDPTWPPALAYDTFEAFTKQVIGSVLRDRALVEEGRAESMRVSHLRDAARLEVEAEQRRRQAEAKYQEEVAEVNDAERAAEAVAKQRRGTAEQRREREQERIAARTERERTAAEQQAEEQREALEAEERKERLATIAEERSAVAREKQANRASARVGTADRKVQATKRARAARKGG